MAASHLLSGKHPSSNHLITGVLQSSVEDIIWIAKRDLGLGRYFIVTCLVRQSSRALANLERQSALTFSSLGV
ncbi:UNVERIFIED_CONTAM: hypothetical protein Slati_4422400 [Sesamum latifolium]|uniref:Uncharacterized protein n=1 Tax=Sesamum latifolium TaxID=2727402 RepID=A0AAW2SQ60_9LAMI